MKVTGRPSVACCDDHHPGYLLDQTSLQTTYLLHLKPGLPVRGSRHLRIAIFHLDIRHLSLTFYRFARGVYGGVVMVWLVLKKE